MFRFLSSKSSSNNDYGGSNTNTNGSSNSNESAFNRAFSYMFSGGAKPSGASSNSQGGAEELKLNVVSSIGYGLDEDEVARAYFEHPYCEEYLLDGVHWDPSDWIVQSVNRSLSQHVACIAESDGMYTMMAANAPSVKVDPLSQVTHILRATREVAVVKSSIVPEKYTMAVMMGRQLPRDVEIKNICIQLMSAIDDLSSLATDGMAFDTGSAANNTAYANSSPEGRVFDIVSMAIDMLIRCLPMAPLKRTNTNTNTSGCNMTPNSPSSSNRGGCNNDSSSSNGYDESLPVDPRLQKVCYGWIILYIYRCFQFLIYQYIWHTNCFVCMYFI